MPRPLPVPLEEIEALLRRGGMTETAMAEQLGVSRSTIHKIRKRMGLPAPLRGSKPKHASAEDAYQALAVPTEDGHAEWTGGRSSTGAPVVRHLRRDETAYRIAYRLLHGREAVGVTIPRCGKADCVAGEHVEDWTIRQAKQAEERANTQGKTGPRPNGSRAEVLALLGQGLSNREIGRRLHTNPRRVAAIRKELGLPEAAPVFVVPTVEEKWASHAQPVGDGHMEWTGSRREGVPVLTRGGRDYMARRVAFEIGAGRKPEGRVRPGCGWADCVAPQHMEDARMRAQYQAIFGAAA